MSCLCILNIKSLSTASFAIFSHILYVVFSFADGFICSAFIYVCDICVCVYSCIYIYIYIHTLIININLVISLALRDTSFHDRIEVLSIYPLKPSAWSLL